VLESAGSARGCPLGARPREAFRRAHHAGANTSDFYGPFVVNRLIREALHPYPADLRIVTKVGARRGEDGSWRPSQDPADLRAQVRENLEHLGVDVLDAVNLRVEAGSTGEDSIAEPGGPSSSGMMR
jgi:pyridoxine 4-dehydrogenase